MRRVLALMACIGFVGVTNSGAQLKIGNAEIGIPSGWQKQDTEQERITIVSADGLQQATVSVMRFQAKPTFAEFKRVCSHRLKAEESEAPDILIQHDEPFEDAGTFGMFFSGKEAKSARLFSGFITQKDKELLTIYIESIGVDSKRHFQVFESFVKGIKRN